MKELKGGVSAHATALQQQLDPIARAAGLAEGADATAVLGAVEGLAAGKGDDATIKALQSELATVTTTLNEVTQATAKTKAEAVVDAAIKAGKPGVKPLRDHYVARHMTDPASVEKELDGMPSLTGRSTPAAVPPAKEGQIALNAAEAEVAAALGIPPEKFAETAAARRAGGEAAL